MTLKEGHLPHFQFLKNNIYVLNQVFRIYGLKFQIQEAGQDKVKITLESEKRSVEGPWSGQEEESISLQLEMAANLADIMNKDVPLLEHFHGGFKTQITSKCTPSFINILNLFGPNFAAFFKVQMDGSVNIEIEDFEELKEYPILAPFLFSFDQLIGNDDFEEDGPFEQQIDQNL